MVLTYAASRLGCRLLHCHFDDDICTTVQAPLSSSGKQRLANHSIISPLCSKQQTADGQILFNFEAMQLRGKAKAAWLLRAVTLKTASGKHAVQRQSTKWQASLKPALLLWIQADLLELQLDELKELLRLKENKQTETEEKAKLLEKQVQ